MITNSHKAKSRRRLSQNNRFGKIVSMVRTNRQMIRVNRTVSHQIEKRIDNQYEDLDEIRHGNIEILEEIKQLGHSLSWLLIVLMTLITMAIVIGVCK